ncbi:hypothetical protein DPEC_G00296790 [Dallia pectoralis]|uniref:Uncharacterized protein n=1 Tax=Dallia pectoralis TaxID=75939 RepID=A0ACC2FFG1_DALPE|nr:hypothetical protein DPEC_G00296790 [Dallia pectoralis]
MQKMKTVERSSMDQDDENYYGNVRSFNKASSDDPKSENDYGNVTVNKDIRDTSGPSPRPGRRVCIWVAVGLAVVCVLQVILNIYLCIRAYSTSGEDLMKITRYDDLIKERDQLQTSYTNLIKERDQLQTSYNNLIEERDQLQTSYNNLIKERDQLQTSYNNLIKERDQLQASYNNLIKERDQLQTSYNNLIKERDQLQASYNTLIRQTCPHDWIKYGLSCYYISSTEKNWADSRQDCLNRGANLVIINSIEEQAFIAFLRARKGRFWIGLSDIKVENTWEWVDGTRLSTSYWYKGEPNNQNNEDCAEILTSVTDESWNDIDCKTTKLWICERL